MSLADECAYECAIERLDRIRENARKHSKSYYQRNYTFWDGMDDEDRARVENNINTRKQRTKNKYENNKDYYKKKQKEYRARAKEREEESASNSDDEPIIKKKIIKKYNPVSIAVLHFD